MFLRGAKMMSVNEETSRRILRRLFLNNSLWLAVHWNLIRDLHDVHNVLT